MDYVNYLKDHQPVVYQTFKNSIERDKLFHAYLLSGQTGTPLLEIAKFLAQSILCDNKKPFACGLCNTCKRVENNEYQDLIILNSKIKNISKEDIINVETQFSKTSIEKKNIRIYIINLVENLNEDCINALLKFLEEPNENTYAILTTESEFSVLPTILSRVQIIHFNLIDKKHLIDEALSHDVQKEDAEILSNFYNDASSIIENCDDNFKKYKEMCKKIINSLGDKNKTRFIIENDVVNFINDKTKARFIFDMIIFYLKESQSYSLNKNTLFEECVESFDSIINSKIDLNNAILKLMNARYEINFNANISLLLLNSFTEIYGG